MRELVATSLKSCLDERYHPMMKTEKWISDLDASIRGGHLHVEQWLLKKLLIKLEQASLSLAPEYGPLSAQELDLQIEEFKSKKRD